MAIKRKYVLAANHQHFMVWCRQNNINPYSKEVVYVSHEQQLMGVGKEHAEFVYYPTWREHERWWQIRQQIRIIENT